MMNRKSSRHLTQNFAVAAAIGLTALALLAAPGTAQGTGSAKKPRDPKSAEPSTLAQAVVVEVYEHNLGKAMSMYRAIIADRESDAADREQAELRLGLALRRLGEVQQSEAILKKLASGGGKFASQAASVLSGAQDDGDLVKAKVQQALAAMRLTGRYTKTELLWIGPAAVPYILDAVRKEKADLRFLANASRVLFEIGGKELAPWIEKLALSKDVLRKRAVIKAASLAGRETKALFAKMLDDADASVRREALQHTAYSAAQVMRLAVKDPDPGVRDTALEVALGSWPSLDHAPLTPVQSFLNYLPVLAQAGDRIPSSALARWLSRGPAPGMTWGGNSIPESEAACRALLTAARLPAFHHSTLLWPWPKGEYKPNQFAKEIGALLRLWGKNKKSEPWAYQQVSNPASFLAHAIEALLPHWDETALPVVLDGMALGYAPSNDVMRWLSKVDSTVSARTVLARLDDIRPGDAGRVAQWLSQIELEERDLPALKKLFVKIRQANGRVRPGLEACAIALRNIGSPEALQFIVREYSAAGISKELWRLVRSRPREIGLLKAIMMTDAEGEEVRQTRALAFDALLDFVLEVDDAPFVRAYELKMEPASPPRRQTNSSGRRFQIAKRGLSAVISGDRMQSERFARLVDACLESGSPDAFYDVAVGIVFSRQLPAGPVVRVLAKHVSRFPPGRTEAESELRSDAMARIFSVLPRKGGEAILIQALSSEDAELRSVATFALDPRFATNPKIVDLAVREFLSGAERGFSNCAQFLVHVPVRPDVLEKMYRLANGKNSYTALRAITYLASKDPKGLHKAAPKILERGDRRVVGNLAEELLRVLGEDAFQIVGELLVRPSIQSSTRRSLATKMGGTMSLKAVPYLIQAMRRPEMQEVARKQLELVRFYHEEKGRWDGLLAAGEFSEPSAMLALIKQARTGSKPVRLAAIQSLGTLKDPESLPYLVKLLGDPDAEVVATAKAALDRVNAVDGAATRASLKKSK